MTGGDVESGKILAECKQLLAELRQTFADDPASEFQRLSMLALEREQLVSYAYREDILGERLDNLVAPRDVIEVMRHAFVQVWRDEEAHTALIRGALVGGNRPVTGLVRATVEQTAGWLAGWSSALKHHVPRSAAPLRSLLVDGLAQSARLIGKLSPDLREELKPKSFREFCRYNIDAEDTAELCWERLVELERQLGGGDVAVFQRIKREEREHGDVFKVVASVLDEHDWLHRGVTADGLAEELRSIAHRFAPIEAGAEARRSTFGSGAPVHVVDANRRTRRQAISDAVDLLGDVSGRSVAIQASWMMGYSQHDPSSIIDPEALDLLVDELIARGANPTVLEAENLYSEIFLGRTVEAVAEHFGIAPACPIVDSHAEVVEIDEPPVLGPSGISRVWVDADLRISMVRLRSHPREALHATTANLESLIPDATGNVFWRRRYDHSVAALTVAMTHPPDLAIIDAWADCPDGLFGLMAGRHVVHPGRLYASTDAMACDLIAMRHTGSARSVTSATLRRAIELFGDPRPHIEVVGTDDAINDWVSPHDNVVSGLLADLSYPVFAYLSRSGALFAPPMDDAFVEVTPLSAPLRGLRSVARVALGLRPPA